MSAGGAEYGEGHSPAPPSTQPQGGNVVTEDWVREIVTDHAFSVQSEFDKIANKLERELGGKVEEATANMKKTTETHNTMMKDLLEKMGTLARALSEEQHRGVERDHDMQSIMGLNLNNQRQPAALSGAPAPQQELDKLKKEIAGIRKQLPTRKATKDLANPPDDLDYSIKNLQHATMDMEDQIKKCIVSIAEHDNRFIRMEKKHTLSIISLSIFSLKALSFPRDQRDRTVEALNREQEELRESLQNEDMEVDEEEEEDNDEPQGRHRRRNVYNDSDSEDATDALEVERNLNAALKTCGDLMVQIDVAKKRRDEQDAVRLTDKLHEAMEKLDKAKRDCHRCGYREKDQEIDRMSSELMTYVES